MTSVCPFCSLSPDRVVDEEGPVLAFRDGFPVSPGHTLLIPRRHVPSFRDLSPDEWAALHILAQRQALALRAADPSISGFNFGANDGLSAGQSVFHCHFHLIPRRTGDHPSPRGGVRAVIPGKADYDASRPPSGFTLIEVLASLALCAFLAITVSSAVAISARTERLADRAAEAALLLPSLHAAARLRPDTPPPLPPGFAIEIDRSTRPSSPNAPPPAEWLHITLRDARGGLPAVSLETLDISP